MISWVCFLSSGLSVWFGGSHKLLGPIFGIVGFIPWTILAVTTEQYGLIPLNVLITVLQVRAFILWRREGVALW